MQLVAKTVFTKPHQCGKLAPIYTCKNDVSTNHISYPQSCTLYFTGVTSIHYVGMHDCFRMTSPFSQKSLVAAGSSSNLKVFQFAGFFCWWWCFFCVFLCCLVVWLFFLKTQQTLCYLHISWLYSAGWSALDSRCSVCACAVLCCPRTTWHEEERHKPLLCRIFSG